MNELLSFTVTGASSQANVAMQHGLAWMVPRRQQSVMPGPHWIQCTTKGVHTASHTKATEIYALSEVRFSCPHRKDVRSHREGTGVCQRKTTTIV